MAKGLSAAKAKKMLEDGRVRGTALTEKQKKLFGAVAGGATPLKAINGGWLDKYQTGGSLPGASGMMYSRNSGSSAMSPPNLTKAQDGTVEYGTPEYKKAYEEGTFADVPNQLDEVVISGYNRNKLSPDQRTLYNMFYKDEDHKDYMTRIRKFNEEWKPGDLLDLDKRKVFTPQIDHADYQITPKDLFRLQKEAGSPKISTVPSWQAQLSPTQMGIKDDSNYFRAHADQLLNKMYIPPLEGARGFANYLAEVAHLHPDFNFTETLSGTWDRIKRGFKEGQSPDISNYKSKKDLEYKTHYIAEDNILDYYFPNQKRDDWQTLLDSNRTPEEIEEAKVERLREKMDKRGITKYKGYQEGGSLPKAQDGDKVMYGTPEYEAAYEEGRFADVPNPLDEVVIDSGVDYEKYPLYDKLSVQEKEYFNDPGTIGRGVRRAAQTDRGLADDTIDMVTGMLVKQPLAGLQVPQSLMVEGIETLRGKDANFLNALTFDTQRLPSQTMGFEDKPGWDVGGSLNTTMDVLADPSNLLGAGLVDDVLKLGLRQGLKNTAVKNIDNLANFKNSVTGQLTKVTNPLSNFRTTMGKLTERFKTQGNAKANPFWKGFNENPVPSAAKFDKDWVSAPGFNQRYDKFVYRHQDPELLKRYRSTQDLINQGLNNLKLKQPDLFTNSSTTVNMFNDSNVAGKILQEELSMPLRQISKMFPRLKTDADMLTGLHHQKSNIGNTLVSARNASMNLDQISATGKFTDVFNANSLSPDDLKYFEENSKVLGFFRNAENRAIINEDAVRAYYGQNPSKMSAYMKSVLNHENSHAIDAGGRAVKPIYNNTTRAAIPEIVDDSKNVLTGVTQKNIEEVWPGFKNLSKERKERLAYLSEPTEVVARIKELRSQFIPKKFVGTDKQYEMSDDLIKKIISEGKKGNTSVDATFFRMIKDKEAFKNLFKVLPAVAAPIAIGAGQQRNGGSTPKAQVGDKVASIASQMEVNEEDGGRPPLGVVDHIRALFDEEGLCRDNTCVQTVKDFYSKAGVEAMPKDVYNNREFLKNFKEYGFEEILDQKNLQPGDVLQYYYGPDSEDVKEDPSYLNFPYHMGVYVNPGEYIGDGDSKAPIQRKNMYTGTKDGKEYKKDPFRAFRYTKQNKNGGWLSKYENGGVIEDDRGQWAHPGKITKINSNNITMKGVNYPVLGVSDTGDTKMMQPGVDNYKYDGNSVTEYPMAKDGKSLVELDQLTNFTNYNTPQPGGWLNKYN